ncbi:MAG: gamma-glutamyl-gamma-aminobutyrate hydrolase family protein [Parachlamydiaceae bacterium]|nr:gamma-glutamyl-gamma-aminobutyrate hydrolase family protein [Parachlamydiaceae bacterium]
MGNKKPIIGILANIEIIDKDPFFGQERSSLNQNYIKAVIMAGGTPIMLPVVQDKTLIQSQMDLIDGLLLTGGYDVHPNLYGEEPHTDIGYVRLDRDHYEIEALKIAHEQHKPIFGICRGLQLMNVAFGGSLYQDLRHSNSPVRIQHSQQAPMHVAWHCVDVLPSTQLFKIVGQETLGTNSFHHQSINKLAPGFIVNAKAKDGIIEGIEKKDHPFFMAVQWHPERMLDHDVNMLKLFQIFVSKAKDFKDAPKCR